MRTALVRSSAWLVLAAAVAPARGAVADRVTLRDGSEALGLVVDSDRGATTLVVRRAWAEAEIPDWAARWAAAEEPLVRRAIEQRRARLEAWRRERRGGPDDRIASWIDARLAAPAAPADSPLMLIRLPRGEAKDVRRRSKADRRVLQLAWKAEIPDAESMGRDDLVRALEGRGLLAAGDSRVTIDDLLPPRMETEAQWLAHRAATEALNDEGVRFIRFGGMVLPEPEPGQPLPAAGALDALGGLAGLIEGRPRDPWPEMLRGLEARGRAGAILTTLDIAPDFSGVRVESAFWVRRGPGRWVPFGSRSAAVRADELRPDAGDAIAADPQVEAVFGAVESLGFGAIPPELKARSLQIGAATQRALGGAGSALRAELEGLALDLDAPRRPAAAGRE